MTRSSWHMLLWGALCGLLGCGSPLVGAECRDGLALCGGRCVDLALDFNHCGECGLSCGLFECRQGACTDDLRPDAFDGGVLPQDGGMDQPPPVGEGDAGPGQSRGGLGTPFLPDGGFDFPGVSVGQSCGIGTRACSDGCRVLSDDPDNCGACGVQCADDQFCFDGQCQDNCDPPLDQCAGRCVLLNDNPNHCGSCKHQCRSGLCESAACADIVAGHVVVIGHDYTTGRNETLQRMAGNAIFLARGAPVRALVYEGDASPASVLGVNLAIERVVALDGRDWEQAPVDADELPEQLTDAAVLVIHAQHGATDMELEDLGTRWGLAMAQFVLRGGVIVLFETSTASNAGTFQLLEPAGLFAADGRESVNGGVLTVLSPGVGVAARATRNYNPADVTVHFLGAQANGNVIVEDAEGEPVVVHRIVAP